MKKTFTLFLGLALCSSINAQTIKFLTLGIGMPGFDEPQLMGQGISPDGKYVCGSIEMGSGYFIADLENDMVVYEVSDDPEGAELRHIDNNGIAIGYNGPGVTYSINGGETILKVPSDDYKYVLGEALSNDGSVMVGSLVAKGFITNAAYSKNGGEWTLLPEADADLLGSYAGDGSAAKYISGDGNIILGNIGSFGPAVIWEANDKGEYEIDPVFRKYLIMSDAEAESGEKELYALSPICLSNNGKYAAMQGIVLADGSHKSVPVVYDVETKALTIYSEPQEIDEYGLGLMPTAICNDGTMIGIIGSQPMYNCFGSFIWEAGEPQAKTFSEAFPVYAESMGLPDSVGYCVPTAMSADGRYLIGYGYYSEDLENMEAPAYFTTYVIDTEKQTGVDSTMAAENKAEVIGVYTIDGKRLERMTKGLNIIQMSDGSVRKVFKK